MKTAVYKISENKVPDSIAVEETWSKNKGDEFPDDYTGLCSFKKDQSSYVIGYAKKRQQSDIYLVNDTDGSLQLTKNIDMQHTYTSINSFSVGGVVHFLFYNIDTGKMDFYRLHNGFSLIRIYSYQRTYGLVTKGFTTIATYSYKDDILVMGYNKDDGTSVVYKVGVPAHVPLFVKNVWTKGWAPGWTRFTFFKMGGENFFLKTNIVYKNVNIDHVEGKAEDGSHPVATHLPLSFDLDAVSAFEFNHDPYFMEYTSESGDSKISRFHGDCLGWACSAQFNAPSGGKHLIPVYSTNNLFIMVY